MERREFLLKGLRNILYTLGVAFAAYPALTFMTYRKTVKRKVLFSPEEQLSDVNFKEGVFLIKAETGDYALSARCTHLGCTLDFDPVTRRFRCPCHGSAFDVSGARLGGPAKEPLHKAPLEKKENGDLMVTLKI